MKMIIIFVVCGILQGSCSAGDCRQCEHVGFTSNQPLDPDDEEALEKVTNFDCAENKVNATPCSSGEKCFSFYSIIQGRGLPANPDLNYTLEIVERGCGNLVKSTKPDVCEDSLKESQNKVAADLQLALSKVSNVTVTGEECDGSKNFTLQVHTNVFPARSGANGRISATKGSLICACFIIFATIM